MDLHAIRRGLRSKYLLAALLTLATTPLLVPAAPAHAASFVVNTTADTHDSLLGNGICADAVGNCSLRAAIEETNARPGKDIVNLPPGNYLLTEPLVVRDDLSIGGANKLNTRLDGNLVTEVLQVQTHELLVCDSGNNSVAAYDLHGKPHNDFIPAGAGAGGMSVPGAVALFDSGADSKAFVTALSGVHRFSTEYAVTIHEELLVNPATAGLEGLAPIEGIFGGDEAPDNALYLADYYPNNRILRVNPYNGDTSTFVASGAGGLQLPTGLAFFDQDLYVSSLQSNQVLRYNGSTGAFVSVFVPSLPSGVNQPHDLVFHEDKLYLANGGGDNVLKYDAVTGAFEGAFVVANAGGLDEPTDLAFGPDGDLYVISKGTKSILRYNGDTGAFRNVFVKGGDADLDNPSCLTWRAGRSVNGPTVYIKGVTIQNGYAGDFEPNSGGLTIDGDARVNVFDSIIRNNRTGMWGGGILNRGNLWLVGVEVIDNEVPDNTGGQTGSGGGIFNDGYLGLRSSLVADNFASRGGGITNQGKLSLSNSTISGNWAVGGGGGIRNVGIAWITWSTITDNDANRPTEFSGTEQDMVGGGIYNSGGAKITMANTILAGNRDQRTKWVDAYSPDCYSLEKEHFTSHRDNLVGILTDNCVLRDTEYDDTRFDLVGSSDTPLDPLLQPLSLAGVYPTRLHELQPTSPAIDADKHLTDEKTYHCPGADQRGLSRPQGPRCDIGAYELVRDVDGNTPGGGGSSNQPRPSEAEPTLPATAVPTANVSAPKATAAPTADATTATPVIASPTADATDTYPAPARPVAP